MYQVRMYIIMVHLAPPHNPHDSMPSTAYTNQQARLHNRCITALTAAVRTYGLCRSRAGDTFTFSVIASARMPSTTYATNEQGFTTAVSYSEVQKQRSQQHKCIAWNDNLYCLCRHRAGDTRFHVPTSLASARTPARQPT